MPESNLAEAQDKELVAGAVSFEDDASAGFEEADKEAFAIPFLRILQKMSPQCDPDEGAYMEDAKPGMFINSVTEEIFDGKEGMTVIPCHYRRSFIEWKPNRGGFVAEYDPAAGAAIPTQRNDKNQDMTADGNQLVDTRMHYVLIVNKDGGTTPAVITLSSTQTKKSKKWMTVMQNLLRERKDGTLYNPAMFASIFHLTTVGESNDQGSWSAWKIQHFRFLDEESAEHQKLYQTARAFRNAVKSGDAIVDHAADDPTGAAPSVSEDMTAGATVHTTDAGGLDEEKIGF